MTGPTIGTHNTHDEAGRVTLFADAIGFCEAIAPKVRERVALAARGYTVRVCREQRDLVFVSRRRLWRITGVYYVPVHDGVPEVTPHRGTFVIEARRRATRRREAFLLGHRINAAFPPYVRGEGKFRKRMWLRHEETDERLAQHYTECGWDVHALGDANTPRGEHAYHVLPWEIGRGFDRIASTIDLVEVEYLGEAGSDHPRLRARLAH